MAYRSNQQLREDIWDYRDRSSSRERENVLRFPRSDEEDFGETALDLVDQAAELFDSMENHAREREAQAHSLVQEPGGKTASGRTPEGSRRTRAARDHHRAQSPASGSHPRLETCREADRSAEDYATAAEFRAQAAENQLLKANRELAAVEEAIRTRLL